MATLMNIELSLPEELQLHVSEQIQSGAYKNLSEYLLILLQHDRKRKLAQDKLVDLLNEGLTSESEPITPDYWRNLQTSVLGDREDIE